MPDLISRSEAKAAGLTRYFTGKPCSNGHLCERMVTNQDCVDCMRARSAKAYGDAQRAKSRERMSRLYRADPEKYRVRSRANYAANPEAWKAKTRDYERRNPFKVRAWHRLKKHKHVPGCFTGDDLIAQYEAQDGHCLCGQNLTDDWTIDHIVPISRGGDHWPANIQLLCSSCNTSKHEKTMDEWIAAK
jgi:5-methylcytosine-specific restriction endonuclease McrA